MDQEKKAARNLVERVRETIRTNIVLAHRSGQLVMDLSSLEQILSLVDSSVNDAFMNGLHAFSREVK